MIQAARPEAAAELNRRAVDHERPDAGNLRHLGTQPGDDLIGRRGPDLARLQIDLDPSGVHPSAESAGATLSDHARVAQDIGVLGHDFGDLGLVFHHVAEADPLHAFRADVESPLILAREKALGHEVEQIHRADEQENRSRHRHRAKAQGEPQRAVVHVEPEVERLLDRVVDHAVARGVRRLQETAAQHRGEADRHEPGDENRHANRHGELVQEPPDDAAHEQHRDEHRRQR